jgi:hypothetical protein
MAPVTVPGPVARLDSDPQATFTGVVPPERTDTRMLIGAGAAAVLAGVVVAVVLLLATSRADSPTDYRPFVAGPVAQLRSDLRKGGPFYFPDAFGGKRSILFALESDQVIALMTHTPGDDDCRVRWRGSVDSFVDCRGNRLRSDQVGRYQTTISREQGVGNVVVVDLRKDLPAPAPAGTPGN